MKVQILGTGCRSCRTLAANTELAIAELGITAEIEKVEKIADIARMGALMTPALAVNGVVVATGVQPVRTVMEILAGDRPPTP
jgi:small redox-active disulfide protein 2